jgi:hypothetical protein
MEKDAEGSFEKGRSDSVIDEAIFAGQLFIRAYSFRVRSIYFSDLWDPFHLASRTTRRKDERENEE